MNVIQLILFWIVFFVVHQIAELAHYFLGLNIYLSILIIFWVPIVIYNYRQRSFRLLFRSTAGVCFAIVATAILVAAQAIIVHKLPPPVGLKHSLDYSVIFSGFVFAPVGVSMLGGTAFLKVRRLISWMRNGNTPTNQMTLERVLYWIVLLLMLGLCARAFLERP